MSERNCKGRDDEDRKCKGKEYKSKEYKGSYTIEAAAILSMTFLMMGALLLCIFYVHDRAVIQSTVCEAAAAGGNFAVLEERSEAAASVTDQISQQRFLGSRGIEISAAVGANSVSAWGHASYPIPGMFASWFTGGVLDISCDWNSRICDPADVIRKIRGAELVIGALKRD